MTIGALPAAAVGMVVGLALRACVVPEPPVTTAWQMARKSLGFMWLATTMLYFPRLLYREFDMEVLGEWIIIGLVSYGLIGLACGYCYGLWKFRKRT